MYVILVGFLVSNRIPFSGVVSGDLLPTTHQPYEADRVEPRPSMSPPSTSTDRPNTAEKGSSHGRALTKNVGIDELTYKHRIATPSSGNLGIDGAGRQADRRRHHADLGRGHESEQLAQPALMGAFIDKPFVIRRRPALAELPFPCKETSQASTEWSAPAQESIVGWGLQSDQQVGFTLPDCRNGSDGWDSGKGSVTSPLSYVGQKHQHSQHFRETRKLSSSAGVHVLQSPGVGTLPVGGIDSMSPASRYFLDDSLRSESWAETPAVGIGSAVGFRSAISVGGSSGHVSGLLGPSSEAWKGWWGGASPSSGGGNSGRPNWGVDGEAGKPADAQRVELFPYGRHQPDPSSERSAYGLRTPEESSLREDDSVSGDVDGTKSNVDGANSVKYGEVGLTDRPTCRNLG